MDYSWTFTIPPKRGSDTGQKGKEGERQRRRINNTSFRTTDILLSLVIISVKDGQVTILNHNQSKTGVIPFKSPFLQN